MTARDQHQPASLRATATVAIVDRFFRTVNCCHLRCRRRLLARPRSTGSIGAAAHRACMTAPGR